jgi:cell division control protein 6
LENTGLTVSHTASKGRQGYGTQYKLTLSPEIVGNACFPDFWKKIEENKKRHELDLEQRKSLDGMFGSRSKNSFFSSTNGLVKSLRQDADNEWKDYVGLD